MADPIAPDGAIFHIAETAEWVSALEAGAYTRSTLDRSLADEGFIHCSEAHQWRATLDRFYANHEGELVLLTIDPSRLTVPLVREVGNPVTGEEFPHLYGPLTVDAVVDVTPISATSARQQDTRRSPWKG